MEEEEDWSECSWGNHVSEGYTPLGPSPTPQVHRHTCARGHTDHARIPVGEVLGVALQVKGCTCGALGSHIRFSQSGVSFHTALQGSAGPHTVPRAGCHPGWRWHRCLHVYVLVSSLGRLGMWHILTVCVASCWRCVCLWFVSFKNTDSAEFPGPQRC